jgi:DNA-binding response OmpR family regulator
MEHLKQRQDDFILLIEDELALAEIVSETLEAKGYTIVHAKNLKLAKQTYENRKPCLIIVDVMLPDGDGFSFVKSLRKENNCIPIIFLTSKSHPQDVVNGFEVGGNDYLKKPFSIAELDVRIKAQLNKNHLVETNKSQQQNIGQYIFKYPLGVLLFNKKSIQLTSRETEILYLLLKHKNTFISRDEILNKIWGDSNYFAGRSLDVFISKLRKYLKQDESLAIKNVRGFGYKFIV